MKFERKHYIYIIIAVLLSLIAIDGTETIINYNNYTNGSSNGSFYNDINMNENNITEVTELRNNGTLYTPYINLGSSKIELGTKFLGSPLKMWDLQITGMNAYYNLNMNNKSLLNCLNCANKTELNDKVNKSGDNMTANLYNNDTIISRRYRAFDTMRGSPISAKPSPLDDIVIEKESPNFIRMLSWANGSTPGNYFGAGVYHGNYTNPLPTSSSPWLFAAFGDAWDGTGATNSSGYTYAAAFGMKTTGTWNSTFHGGQLIFYTRKPSNTLNSLTMGDDGNITLSASAGTGYRFGCWDSTGKLIQSDISCDLI